MSIDKEGYKNYLESLQKTTEEELLREFEGWLDHYFMFTPLEEREEKLKDGKHVAFMAYCFQQHMVNRMIWNMQELLNDLSKGEAND